VQFVQLVHEVELPPLFAQDGILVANIFDQLIHARDLRVDADALVDTRKKGGMSGFGPDLSSSPVATPSAGPSRPAATRPPTAPPATATPTDAPSAAPSAAPTAAPTAVSTPEPSAAPEFRIYQVKNGDTLSAIAARFDTTVSAIVNLNNLKNANALNVGQELKIPN
jgi:LysM repeat protein